MKKKGMPERASAGGNYFMDQLYERVKNSHSHSPAGSVKKNGRSQVQFSDNVTVVMSSKISQYNSSIILPSHEINIPSVPKPSLT